MAKRKELSGIERAVGEAGSQASLAKRLGVSRQAVRRWVIDGHVPLGRSVEIETEFGIPRRELLERKLADLMDKGLGE